jgi:hypothetical protein
MRRTRTALLAFAIGAAALSVPVLAALPAAQAWEIGPVIKSRNYSHNMPLRPTAVRGGMRIDFPWPDAAEGHIHYVTFRHGPLEGKRRIVMRYRIDAEPGTRFVPQEHREMPAMLSLFFQQRGDTWTAKGRYETYRWYAPDNRTVELTPGEHTLTIALDDPGWISVNGRTAAQLPGPFRAALADAERVGFVLGSPAARGHGVFATGPAALTVTAFEVQ